MCGVSQLTEQAVLNLITSIPNLRHLDIYDNPNISERGVEMLVEIACQRNITIILKQLKHPNVAPDNGLNVLPIWRSVPTT